MGYEVPPTRSFCQVFRRFRGSKYLSFFMPILRKNMVAQDLTRGSKMWYNYYNGGVLLKKIKSCSAAPFLFGTTAPPSSLSNKCSVGRPPAPRNVKGAAPFAAPFRGHVIGGTAPWANALVAAKKYARKNMRA